MTQSALPKEVMHLDTKSVMLPNRETLQALMHHRRHGDHDWVFCFERVFGITFRHQQRTWTISGEGLIETFQDEQVVRTPSCVDVVATLDPSLDSETLLLDVGAHLSLVYAFLGLRGFLQPVTESGASRIPTLILAPLDELPPRHSSVRQKLNTEIVQIQKPNPTRTVSPGQNVVLPFAP